MRISNLGLTPAEVDEIMMSLTDGAPTARPPEPIKTVGEPAPDKAIIKANPVQPAKDNTKSKDVGTSLLPPKVVPPGVLPSGAPAPKKGVGAYLAAAGAGFLVGGPVGALVGAGAVAVLRKKPAPPPGVSAVTEAGPIKPKPVQVTPTSAPSKR